MPRPPETERRFEAIVVARDGAATVADARPTVDALRAAGVLVTSAEPGALTSVVDDLWRRGIAPTEIALIGNTDDRVPHGVVCLDGGAPSVRTLLDEQLLLRRGRPLPLSHRAARVARGARGARRRP